MLALQIGLQVLDVFALLADNTRRAGTEDGNPCVLCRALDDDAANGCVRQLLLQVVANLNVFLEHLRKVLAVGIPAGSPVTRDRKTKSGRMNLLSHRFPP
jgi:hypothetical protein